MKTSSNGIDLIKRFEGCKLKAYKPVSTEKYYTIGYGHYGSDVTKNMVITQAKAEELLVKDLIKFENYINSYNLSWINQNRFDALVSFAYNCGAGNLKSLLNNGKRPASEVSDKLLAYNKAGGVVLKGLVTRRKAEKKLFDTPVNNSSVSVPSQSNKGGYNMPTITKGSKGKVVKIWQIIIGADPDGSFGPNTWTATKVYQKKHGLNPDGTVGPTTWDYALNHVS